MRLPVTFVTPWLVWVAAAIPLAVFLLVRHDRAHRRQLTGRLGELPVVGRILTSASPGRRIAKAVLAGTAAALIAFAAARPQIAGTRKVELHGLDLVVAIDVSKSMLVDDVATTVELTAAKQPPTRLGRARELARAVIDELPGDRIAPIAFAAAAAHFPLTEDRVVAGSFLRDIGPVDLPQGSNLAEVFRVARCLLRPDLYEDLGCAQMARRGHGGDPLHGESLDPRPAPGGKDAKDKDREILEQKVERGKAIVVFTDGGDTNPATLREVAVARELGIAVFLVGFGSPEGGTVYEIDPMSGARTKTPKRLPDGTIVVSRRDDAGMKALATAAGDEHRYLVSAPLGEVDPRPIVDALHIVNRGLATKEVKDLRDIYQPFLFAAFMLLLVEAAIGTRRRTPSSAGPEAA